MSDISSMVDQMSSAKPPTSDYDGGESTPTPTTTPVMATTQPLTGNTNSSDYDAPNPMPVPITPTSQVNQGLINGATQFGQGVVGGIAGAVDTINAVGQYHPAVMAADAVSNIFHMTPNDHRTQFQQQYEQATKPNKSLWYGAGQAAPSAVASMFLPGELAAQVGYGGVMAGGEELNHQMQMQKFPGLRYAKEANGNYATNLGSAEAKFQQWVKQNKVPFQDGPYSDYDMRGYFKDHVLTGKQSQTRNVSDGLMHFPDTYKTPYHQSFSNESKYANPNIAPRWEGNDQIGYRLRDPQTGNLVFDEGPPGKNSAKSFTPNIDWGAVASQAGGAAVMTGLLGGVAKGVGKVFAKEAKPTTLMQVVEPHIPLITTKPALQVSQPKPPIDPNPPGGGTVLGPVQGKVEQDASGIVRHRRTLKGYDRYQNATPLKQALQQIPEVDRPEFEHHFHSINNLAKLRKEAAATRHAAQEIAHQLQGGPKVLVGHIESRQLEKIKPLLKNGKEHKLIMHRVKEALLRREGKIPKPTSDLEIATLGEHKPAPNLEYFRMPPGTPHTKENLIKYALLGAEKAYRDEKALAKIESEVKAKALPFFQRVLNELQTNLGDKWARLHVGDAGSSVELKFAKMVEDLDEESQTIYDAINLAIINKMPQQMSHEYKLLGTRIGSGTVKSMKTRLEQGGVLALGTYGVDIAAQAADRSDRADYDGVKSRALMQWGGLGLAGIALLTAARHGKISKSMNRLANVIIHDMQDHMYRAQSLLSTPILDTFKDALHVMSVSYRQAGHSPEIVQRAFDSLARRSGIAASKLDGMIDEYQTANQMIANPATQEQGQRMLQGLASRYGFDNLPSINVSQVAAKVAAGTASNEEKTINALHNMLTARHTLKDHIDQGITRLSDIAERYKHHQNKHHVVKSVERTLTSLKFAKATLEGRLNEFANDFDKAGQAYMAKFMTAFFKMNPTFANIINRSDSLITGAPYVSAGNITRAGAIAEKSPIKGYLLNLTRPLRANKMYETAGIKADAQKAAHPAIGGYSGDTTKAGQQIAARVEKAFASDIDNAAVSWIGGIVKFYEENATWMRSLGIQSDEQLVKEVLSPTSKLAPDLVQLINGHALATASRTTGGNSFHLAGGLIARSMLARGGNFFKQPERTIHAMTHAVLKGAPAAFFAMMLVQQQLGGSAVLPPTLTQVWGKTDPETLAYTIAMLNKYSAFRQIAGDLSDKLRSPDPVSLAGGISSTLGMMEQTTEDLQTSIGRLYDILNSANGEEDVKRLTDVHDKKTQALLAELRRLANVITHTMQADIAGVPIGKAGDTLMGVANATANQVEINYPQLTGKGKPTKKSEFVNADQFGGMQNVWDWPLRRMTGAPRPTVMANIANEEGLKALTQSGRLKRGATPKPKYTPIYDIERQKEIQAQRHGFAPDWDENDAGDLYRFFTDVPDHR